jgi:dipeptidyl aminopeptidase/acylaminoacyl peptidase
MKRKIDLKDAYSILYVSDAQISPDGEKTAFVQTRSQEDGKGYRTSIWLVGIGKEKICIADEENYSSMPRWSPDGKSILFVSSADGVRQLFSYSFDNGKTEQLTLGSNNKSFPSWSPDGSKIAYVETISSDFLKREAMEINVLKHKADSALGLIDIEEKKRIAVLDMDTRETSVVTPDDFFLADPEFSAIFNPSWSQDGKRLVFASKVQDPLDRDLNPWKANIFIVDINEGKPIPVKKESGPASKPIWDRDEESVIFIGHINDYKRATTQRLCRQKINEEKIEFLSKDFDRNLGDFTQVDSGMGYSGSHPVLSKLRNKVYFNASDRGRVSIFSLDLDTCEVQRVIGGERRIYGFSMSRDEKKISFCYSNVQMPGDIGIFDLDTGEETRLTEVNGELLKNIELSTPEEIKSISVDGLEINGWVMKPIGCLEGEKYPAILNIHGGPNLNWGPTFSFEAQMLAASGYGMIYCNPRGSRSYGQAFTAAIHNEFGGLDFEDFMGFTDKAIERGFIDPEKLAVMGISYGGFSTNWIVSHSDRFKVAMSQAGVSNWMTMFSLSDFGYSCTAELLGWDQIEDLIDLWKVSPLAYAKDINTPMLFMHGVKDMRCPIDQGEQLYMYLKSLGRECRMVRFPESNHMLPDIDGPLTIKIRLEYLLEYFGRYLN